VILTASDAARAAAAIPPNGPPAQPRWRFARTKRVSSVGRQRGQDLYLEQRAASQLRHMTVVLAGGALLLTYRCLIANFNASKNVLDVNADTLRHGFAGTRCRDSSVTK
jgi:hypothetical protein